MKSRPWLAGRAVTPVPPGAAVRRCSCIPGEQALCVSTDAFEDSLRGAGGTGATRTPLPPCWSRASGRGPRRDLPGIRHRPLPRADSLSQAHPLPCPCQNPHRIIRPAARPALPKHKPFPTRINSPSLGFYKQPIYFFFRVSAIPAVGAGRGSMSPCTRPQDRSGALSPSSLPRPSPLPGSGLELCKLPLPPQSVRVPPLC